MEERFSLKLEEEITKMASFMEVVSYSMEEPKESEILEMRKTLLQVRKQIFKNLTRKEKLKAAQYFIS